jgi:hypothetical protein
VALALIAALAAVYAPGVLRAWKFRTTINAMLGEIKGGKVRNVVNYVLPEQQADVGIVVMHPTATHYAAQIASLKLTSYRREDSHIWAIVTAKFDSGGIGQGNLRWEWDGQQWRFDALNSYISQGIGVREGEDMKIGDMLDNVKSNEPLVDEESLAQ